MYRINYNANTADWHKKSAHEICDKTLDIYIDTIDNYFDATNSSLNTKKVFDKKIGLKDDKEDKKITLPDIRSISEYKSKSDSELKEINDKIKKMLEYIKKKEDDILIGSPKLLMGIYDHIRNNFNFVFKGAELYQKSEIQQDGFVFNMLENIFNYDKYSSKYAYELTKRLNVNICPYCNREFIYTVIADGDEEYKNCNPNIMRPDIDHYFGQKKLPLFRLSFQNLIPSGVICNRTVKGARELDINKHLHPYIHEEEIHFKTEMNSKLEIKCKIDAPKGSKAYKTADFFKIDRIYDYHSNVADKAGELMKEYPKEYIEELERKLKSDSTGGRTVIKDISRRKIFDIIFSEFMINSPDDEMLGVLKDDIYQFIHDIYFEK